MKRVLLFFAAVIITSMSTYASVPANHPKLGEYYARRYVTFNYAGAAYRVDLNQVQSIIQNLHNHFKSTYQPAPDNRHGANYYYVLFKNGHYLFVDTNSTNPKPMPAWIAYTDFLRDNPQFATIP